MKEPDCAARGYVTIAPGGERDAALRYLARLAERASRAESGAQIAEVLTELAGPDQGVLPLVHEVLAGVQVAWSHRLDAPGADSEPVNRLGTTAEALARAADRLLRARNYAARTPQRSTAPAPPPGPAQPPPSARRR
ncbi:hypothetical protein ACFU99_12020 [Streptomyces sp. NPDC057654]|uniref:hypothetical protein n=1 Tax=Streptomyces sp. NPDC057654 TaxID=3346196 RepID=UPI0036AE199D